MYLATLKATLLLRSRYKDEQEGTITTCVNFRDIMYTTVIVQLFATFSLDLHNSRPAVQFCTLLLKLALDLKQSRLHNQLAVSVEPIILSYP